MGLFRQKMSVLLKRRRNANTIYEFQNHFTEDFPSPISTCGKLKGIDSTEKERGSILSKLLISLGKFSLYGGLAIAGLGVGIHLGNQFIDYYHDGYAWFFKTREDLVKLAGLVGYIGLPVGVNIMMKKVLFNRENNLLDKFLELTIAYPIYTGYGTFFSLFLGYPTAFLASLAFHEKFNSQFSNVFVFGSTLLTGAFSIYTMISLINDPSDPEIYFDGDPKEPSWAEYTWGPGPGISSHF